MAELIGHVALEFNAEVMPAGWINRMCPISTPAQLADTLCLACDETASIERLRRVEGPWQAHRHFVIGDLGRDVPGEAQEALDSEGLGREMAGSGRRGCTRSSVGNHGRPTARQRAYGGCARRKSRPGVNSLAACPGRRQRPSALIGRIAGLMAEQAVRPSFRCALPGRLYGFIVIWEENGMRITSLCTALFLTGQAAIAGGFDGLYHPAGSTGWDCRTIGADMGALAIRDGRLEGVENSCEMTNPVSVRDMAAVLYDLECSGEGMTHRERALLMKSDHGVYVIRDGYVADWARCD